MKSFPISLYPTVVSNDLIVKTELWNYGTMRRNSRHHCSKCALVSWWWLPIKQVPATPRAPSEWRAWWVYVLLSILHFECMAPLSGIRPTAYSMPGHKSSPEFLSRCVYAIRSLYYPVRWRSVGVSATCKSSCPYSRQQQTWRKIKLLTFHQHGPHNINLCIVCIPVPSSLFYLVVKAANCFCNSFFLPISQGVYTRF